MLRMRADLPGGKLPALTMLCLLAAPFYAFLGFEALGRDRRSALNRVFALLAGCFAFWTVSFGFLYAAPNVEVAGFWYGVAAPFWTAASGLVLHFVILLTRRGWRIKVWTYLLLYFPLIVALVWQGTGRRWFDVGFEPGPWGWIHDVSRSRDWFVAFLAVYVLQLSTAAYLVARWRKDTRLNRERRQATLILGSGLTAFALAFVLDAAWPMLSPERLPVLSPVVALIWFAGLAVAMVKHRLMLPTVVVRPEQIVDGTSDLLLVVDSAGQVLEVNRRVEDLLGRPGREVLGGPARCLAVDPAEGARLFEGGPTGVDRGMVLLQCKAADGTSVPLGFRGHALANPDGDPLGVLFIGQDLRMALALRRETEGRSVAERGLAVERALVEAALDSISDGVFVLDGEGRIRLVNTSATALVSRLPEDLVGRLLDEVVGLRDEGTGAALRWDDLLSACCNPDRPRILPPVRLLDLPGGRTRLVELVFVPLRVPSGETGGFVAALRDVTERRSAEAELARAAKMESLGVLAAGIAHDFNNVLTAVIGYVAMARANPGKVRDVDEYLARAEDQLERAKCLMRQLLSFSHGGKAERHSVDLRAVLGESASLLGFGGRWTVDVRTPDDLWSTPGDKAQFRQVFDNLLLNARQAMPDGGRVAVVAANVVVGEPEASGHPRLCPGAHVRVSVTDEGPGIPSEILRRIFDPFFTTKPEGTGLGLSTVFAVVSGHRGAVEARSTAGTGATFEVLLPADAP